jgi:hypothetical protein
MTSGILPQLPTLGGSTANPAPTDTTTGADNGPGWLTGTLAQYVTIGLGLILIIAGLFQFKSVAEGTGFAAKAAIAA